MSKSKYYCEQCGALCIWSKRTTEGFDSKTGKAKRIYYQLTCPNYKWYAFGHFNERVRQDKDGDFFYDAGNEFGPFYIKGHNK